MAQVLVSAFLVFISLPPLFSGLTYDEWKEDYDKSRSPTKAARWFPVRATHGEPIPMPQSMKTSAEEVLTIIPTQFEIVPIGSKCDILSHAVQRYFGLILQGERSAGGYPFDYTKTAACEDRPLLLHKIYIDVGNPCDGGVYPSAASVENYSLEITSFGAVLKATEVWGALRGLETFSQLVHRDSKDRCLQIKQAKVDDFPRFTYRGILLDSGRHFLSKVGLRIAMF